MKKLVSLALVSAMSLSLLAGCGGEKPTPSQAPAEESKAVAGEAFNMNVNIASEPESLDPAKNTASDGNVMIQHMFEGLMTWKDSGEAVEGAQGANLAELVPGQAETYDKVVNDDGTVTYTFHLRDGIKWSDGPSPPATLYMPGSAWPPPPPPPTTAT